MKSTSKASPVVGDEIKRRVLDQLVLAPRMKAAARTVGVHPTTLFRWVTQSIDDPEKHTLQWLGRTAPFFQHINAARRLNIVAIDHSARDLAINGHASPKFHDGKPVWKIDAKMAADAKSMSIDDFHLHYGLDRDPADCYERDADGALVQVMDISPPNPAILVKLLTSLAPTIYGDRSELSVTHSGHVWVEGGAQQTPALMPPPDDANQLFGLTARPEEAARSTNVLVAPRPCVDSAEFDARWRKKLLRDVVLFRDADGKLLGPLPDDQIVAGSVQHRAFQDAGIAVDAVHPTTLLDEGFENDWLVELAPGYARKPPKATTTDAVADTAVALDTALTPASSPAERPGKASASYDSENFGYGKPRPGGRRVQL
jgi:hypothetical protein